MHLEQLTDTELLVRLRTLALQERDCAADMVEHLAELERRGSVTDTGCSSLFDYCVRTLRYSEAAAFLRIRAARAALTDPRMIGDLRTGALHLDAVARLAPHLTPENSDRLLDLASGATKRQVQALVAGLDGETPPPERDVVRVVSAAPVERGNDVIPPPSRVRLSFTADDAFLSRLEKLRGLLRHRFPQGRLEDVINDAVCARVSQIDPAAPRRPREAPRARSVSRGRWVPRAIRRAVWRRDGGRCAFIGPDGRRCGSADFLEVDHIVPFALGGPTTLSNLRLLCRPHNQRQARKRFGAKRPPGAT